MALVRIYFESMAGTHLLDAIDALRNASSPDALYGENFRNTPPSARSFEDTDIAEQEAMGRRMAYSRHALLFAAFAAEAYVNDFILEHIDDQPDRDSLLRLPTVEKYIFVPRLVHGRAVFERGRAPWGSLKWLFRRRDELVHAKTPNLLQLAGERPDIHNPGKAAEGIVAVADSAVLLGADPVSVAATIHSQRAWCLSFGKQATETLPSVDDPPAPFDLYLYVRKRLPDLDGSDA